MDKPKSHVGAMITPESLLAKMRAGVKEVHEIKMRDLVVPVRVLSQDEVNAVRREAIAKATGMNGDDVDKNVWVQKLTLKLASDVTKKNVPILSDSLLGMLTTDELAYLYEEYITAMDSVNPSLETLSGERFREIVDALKKSQLGTRDLSLLQLRAICTAFVELIERQDALKSQKGN